MDSLTTIANRHDATATFTTEYDEDVTAKTIITPTSGKRICVHGVFLSTEGAASAGAKVRLYFATSADTVASIYVTNAVQNTLIPSVLVEGGIDEPLKMTSTLGAGKNYHFVVNYSIVS
jgi:hypothetical protein